MQELLAGLFHWQPTHPKIGLPVGCHYVAASGTVIDPLLPEQGLAWFEEHPPQRIVLSTRHHLRDAEQIAERFDCPILAHEDGLHEFEDGPEVEGFAFGAEIADDVSALTMDAISPDDTVLRIGVAEGALLFADSVINHGGIGFVPDNLIGEDPDAVKRKILERSADLLDEDFDHLLFAHGDPVIGGGKEALRNFAQVD